MVARNTSLSMQPRDEGNHGRVAHSESLAMTFDKILFQSTLDVKVIHD